MSADRLDFGAMRESKQAQRTALLGALAGQPTPADATGHAPEGGEGSTPTHVGGGFDGGARQAVPLPGPTHNEVLSDLFSQVRARESGTF